MIRTKTKTVMVGTVPIGGANRVVIQSMTTTKTKQIEATVAQIERLTQAGCEIVRLAVLDMEDALSIGEIKRRTQIPLVADIHFDYRLALTAIEQGIDKIRINPGNIGSDDHVFQVVEACKKRHIPIRIGVNSGSLEKHILEEYGRPSAEAMVASAAYHVALLEKFDFTDIVISLKATDMMTTIAATRLASKKFPYPLHLGITEAGTTFSGTIRSSIGLGSLLLEGIGDTMRVSLTADPVEEIAVAKEILQNVGLYKKPRLISCPTCGRIEYDMVPIAEEIEQFLQTIQKDIHVAIMGCAVNGPGEAKDANIAIAGGAKEALLYIDGEKIKKVPQEQLVETLKEAILNYPER
ncbi:MAG: flavodoxin-dependent (E)-4-hydroxy-3-methylbut-2-enyl-diphosphate synthase [Candidatus Izemoplasmatales bacterium]